MKLTLDLDSLSLKTIVLLRKAISAEMKSVSKKRKQSDSVGLRRMDWELTGVYTQLNRAVSEKL